MEITGKLWTRNAGEADKGRKLIIVTGIIAVPEDFEPTNEDMFIAAGDLLSKDTLHLILKHDENIKDETYGDSPTGILRKPLWQY